MGDFCRCTDRQGKWRDVVFSRFLARAILVPEVFLEIRCRRFAARSLFFREEKFQEKSLGPGYARAIFRENLV